MVDQIQRGFAEVNGTRLYYEVAGDGHPLVLNHGGLVDNHLWDDQFVELAKHFKVIRYDMLGLSMGGSLSVDFTLQYPDMDGWTISYAGAGQPASTRACQSHDETQL